MRKTGFLRPKIDINSLKTNDYLPYPAVLKMCHMATV